MVVAAPAVLDEPDGDRSRSVAGRLGLGDTDEGLEDGVVDGLRAEIGAGMTVGTVVVPCGGSSTGPRATSAAPLPERVGATVPAEGEGPIEARRAATTATIAANAAGRCHREPPPTRTCARASATSSPLANLESGDFARHRRTNRSRSGGRSRRSRPSGVGSSLSMAMATAIALEPEKGRLPPSSS